MLQHQALYRPNPPTHLSPMLSSDTHTCITYFFPNWKLYVWVWKKQTWKKKFDTKHPWPRCNRQSGCGVWNTKNLSYHSQFDELGLNRSLMHHRHQEEDKSKPEKKYRGSCTHGLAYSLLGRDSPLKVAGTMCLFEQNHITASFDERNPPPLHLSLPIMISLSSSQSSSIV